MEDFEPQTAWNCLAAGSHKDRLLFLQDCRLWRVLARCFSPSWTISIKMNMYENVASLVSLFRKFVCVWQLGLDISSADRLQAPRRLCSISQVACLFRSSIVTADQHTQTNLPYEDEAFVPVAQSSTPIWFPQGLLLRAVVRRVQRARGDVPGEGSWEVDTKRMPAKNWEQVASSISTRLEACTNRGRSSLAWTAWTKPLVLTNSSSPIQGWELQSRVGTCWPTVPFKM